VVFTAVPKKNKVEFPKEDFGKKILKKKQFLINAKNI